MLAITSARFRDNQTALSLLDEIFSDEFDIFDCFKPVNRNLINSEKTEIGIRYYLEVPGIKKDQLKVTCENNTINIEGKTPRAKEFKYQFNISPQYNINTLSAALEDGVLTMNVDKKEELKSRQIIIK